MKPIRLLCTLIVALCLLPCIASAETAPLTEIVGETPDDYIHRYIAPNGQEIYFLSRETDPFVRFEDVNFDGEEDLIILVTRGAANFFSEFFVWDDGQYTLVTNNAGITGGLPNYTLYPEKGLVHCEVNNGWAGLLGEDHIFRWEGTQLIKIRHSLSDHAYDAMFTEDDFFVQITDNNSVRFLVEEIHYGELNPTYETLWEITLSNEEAQARDSELLSTMRETLWRGL